MNVKILQVLTLTSGLIFFSACGSSSKSSTPDANTTTQETNTTIPVSTSIMHNGTSYGFVTSPHTGKVWLDRNLGAAEVCASFDDAQCYGDYYQWGRNFDGHQDKMSATTGVQATSVDNAGDAFIISRSDYDYDWAYGIDIQSIKRNENWLKTDGSSICPKEYRVPTIQELEVETINADVNNSITAFQNFLKLPSAGDRNYEDALVRSQNNIVSIWASDISTNPGYTRFLRFWKNGASSSADHKAFGFSVRCIKD